MTYTAAVYRLQTSKVLDVVVVEDGDSDNRLRDHTMMGDADEDDGDDVDDDDG